MKITQITQQKRNIENVNIFLDGEYWISLSKNQLIQNDLYKNREITEPQKKDLEKASNQNKIIEKVTNYVLIRPRSEKEIHDYLVYKKKYSKEEFESVKSELSKKKLINDKYFANWLVEQRVNSSKLSGVNKIKAELFKKGINSKLVRETLSNIEIKTDQSDLEKFIDKEIQKDKTDDKYKLKNKILSKLIRKGFEYGEVKDLVSQRLEVKN